MLIYDSIFVFSYKQKPQNCAAPRFNCDLNDPCDPLCVAGQFHYPGQGPSRYITCAGGLCKTHRCPRGTKWNQANLRCQANG